MKYVYCIPRDGFNDNLCVIFQALEYCKKHNRILLVDTINSTYKVDFNNYFKFKHDIIDCDSNKIRSILYDKEFTIYPSILCGKMNDILDNKIIFNISKKNYSYENIELSLPNDNIDENIVVFVALRSDKKHVGYPLFKEITFKSSVRQIIIDRYKTLKPHYLAFQIRNTDRICDYKVLYENNKEILISSNENIYIATDDKNALDFFIDKGLPVKNFTTYPIKNNYTNLHYSGVDPHTKFIDMLSDIYICGMAEKLISSSVGGFIRLIKDCNENKSDLAKQFEIIEE
jgi:hypothetical protein